MATFGDVLYGLGNRKRAAAKPKDPNTAPIYTRLTKKEWTYFKQLNETTNPKTHSLVIPEVDGKMKLVLPDDKALYNPDLIMNTFLKLNIINQGDEIKFEKENEPSGSEKSGSPTKSDFE